MWDAHCAPLRFRFSFQTATFIHACAIAPAPCCASCARSLPPHNMRGMERREAHLVLSRFRHPLARRRVIRKRIALRRSIRGDFGRGDRASGTGQARIAPLIRPAFAAFILSSSSHRRQSHVVGPDGDPSLPGATGANRARRRRILLRFKSALEKRPSRTGHAEPKRGPERGDCCPHHEMFRESCVAWMERSEIRDEQRDRPRISLRSIQATLARTRE